MLTLDRMRRFATSPYRAFRSLIAELLTPFNMWRINGEIEKRPIATGGPIASLSVEDLGKLIESEWTRSKELDDKLQKLTAALSVSVTVGGLVGSTMLQDLASSGWKITAAVLFLLAAGLLLTGVVLGFNGLRPKQRYGYGAGYMSIVAVGGDKARAEMIAAVRAFERDNLMRANEAYAAIASIRNGVLTFAVAMLVGLIATGLGKSATGDHAKVVGPSAVEEKPAASLQHDHSMLPMAPLPAEVANSALAPTVNDARSATTAKQTPHGN